MEEYKHKVQYYETDKMGITHHSNYIHWMEEARVDFLERIGWSYERLEDTGLMSPVTEVTCRYKAPSTFGDTIYISVTIEKLGAVRMRVKYIMTNQNGAVVCECVSEHYFINKDGRIVRLNKDCPGFYSELMKYTEERNI